MASHRLYDTVLTDEEKKLGFIRAFVNNPDFVYHGNGSIVPAIILVLGPGDRIIKLSTGEYSHQTFGTYFTTSKRHDWVPVSMPIHDAKIAISLARSGQDAQPPLGQKVHPAPTTIALACPDCAKEFDLPKDHLPIAASATCPHCGKERKADECERFNV